MIEYLGYILYKNKEDETKEAFSGGGEGIISFFLSFMFSILAVILSWNCNTRLRVNTGLKVLYAIIAFIFGLLYLIFYLFSNLLGNGCGP